MSVQFPPEFQRLWREPIVKFAAVSENKPIKPSDCQNCGGAGIMSTFVGSKGPFLTPSNAIGDVNHYHDGRWWVGKTYTATCPVCKGSSVNSPY